MFKCEKCGKNSHDGEPARKIITERRNRTYVDMKTGAQSIGWEIVKEIKACPPCFAATQVKPIE